MTKTNMTEKLGIAGIVAIVTFGAACLGLFRSVLCKWPNAEVAFGWVAMLSVVVMAVGLVTALIGRKWIIAIVIVAGGVISAVVGFFTAIMLAAANPRPPMDEVEEVEDWNILQGDATGVRLLTGDLPKGSWWTDGEQYFQVVRTGQTIRMEGMTLHEGGLVLTLRLADDTLRVAESSDGLNTFAETGYPVFRYELTHAADGTPLNEPLELLVARTIEDELQPPVAILQRFDGDELRYELAGIHALLEGTYRDDAGKTEWTFLPDGTMKLSPSAEAKPYGVERFYHMTTNVVSLPDGRRVALELTREGLLRVMAAHYDDSEEAWLQDESMEVTMQLARTESWQADEPFWGNQRLFTPAMARFLEGTYGDLMSYYHDLMSEGIYPLSRLNYEVLFQLSLKEFWESDE